MKALYRADVTHYKGESWSLAQVQLLIERESRFFEKGTLQCYHKCIQRSPNPL